MKHTVPHHRAQRQQALASRYDFAMQAVRRAAVAAICYALSLGGILYSLMLLATAGRSPLSLLVGIAVTLAWSSHLVMSLNWILGRKIQKPVWLCGTLCGALSLLLWPFAFPPIRLYDIGNSALQAVAIGALFTLPCLLLAVYLVWLQVRHTQD